MTTVNIYFLKIKTLQCFPKLRIFFEKMYVPILYCKAKFQKLISL